MKIRQHSKSKKTATLLSLLLIMLLSISMLFVTACGNKDESSESKHPINTVETDEQLLTNGNFEFGTADVELSKYPYSSNINWTRSYSDARSSTLSSGIISTEEEAFNAFLESAYGSEVDKDIKYPDDATEEEKDNLRKEELSKKLANPGVREGALGKEEGETGKKVLLISNKTSTEGQGTAQKFTSSKTLNLAAGEYGKFSVWVKTANLKTRMIDRNFGANINLVNTVNGVTQDQFSVKNIQAADWTQYTVYVKGNDISEVTLKVVLGLGEANGGSKYELDYVEGQAFFDDAVYEEITKEAYEAAVKTIDDLFVYDCTYLATAANGSLGYDATNHKKVFVSALNCDPLAYDGFSDSVTVDKATEGFGANGNASVVPVTFDNVPKIFKNNKGYTYNVSKTIATSNFYSGSLNDNNFFYMSFYVRTNLSLTSTGLNIYLIDKGLTGANLAAVDYKITKFASDIITQDNDSETLGDWVRYAVLINNNFKNDPAKPRDFDIRFIIGPTNPMTSEQAAYPTGTVDIANIEILTGNIQSEEDKNTDLYDMLNKTVNSTTVNSAALYAGRNTDYTEETDNDAYSFAVAPNSVGKIENAPSEVKGYEGVVGNHRKVNPSESDIADFNSDKTVNGLINSKYFDAYGAFLTQQAKDAFNYLKDDESVQPLMIYNKEANSYGYIPSQVNNLAASTFATVTAKVKVLGEAKAYIYLVNTEYEAMAAVLNQKFDNGTVKLDNNLIAVVDKNTETDENGWATITFYVSSGKDALNFRVELWNGSRDDKEHSQGYVFFNDITVNTSSSEMEFEDMMNEYEAKHKDLEPSENYVRYTQALNDKEIKFNKTAKDEDKIKYTEKVVFFKDANTVYARMDTINPVENDPTADDSGDDSSSSSGTSTNNNRGANFWLSFSSILLAVLIVVVIVFMVVRKTMAKKKAKESGAIQTYNIHSRNAALKDSKAKKAAKEAKEVKPEKEEEKTAEEKPEEVKEEPEQTEQEEYTYGEVQDFTEDEAPEKTDEPKAETPAEEKPDGQE